MHIANLPVFRPVASFLVQVITATDTSGPAGNKQPYLTFYFRCHARYLQGTGKIRQGWLRRKGRILYGCQTTIRLHYSSRSRAGKYRVLQRY